jgi:hypothetical protein
MGISKAKAEKRILKEALQRAEKKVSLIRLQDVLQMVRATIWTGRISEENPVSLCLVAPQESAKSQCLLHFYETETLRYFSDITAKPLNGLKREIETKRLRHLVLLDLVQIMNHQKSVAARTLQRLAGLMEEGQAAVADAGGVEDWKGMPKLGVLMALTPSYYLDQRARWYKSGFISRFLRCWFTYSDATVDQVHRAIREGMPLPSTHKEPLPEDGQLVHLSASQAESIEGLTRAHVGQVESEGIYGFRYHRQMRALAKALALMDKRQEVSDKDISVLASWQGYFTGKRPVEI